MAFSGKAKEITMRQAYAVFWIDANGRTGNGEYILDEETLHAWLVWLQHRYPDMHHWGQLPPIDTIHGIVG